MKKRRNDPDMKTVVQTPPPAPTPRVSITTTHRVILETQEQARTEYGSDHGKILLSDLVPFRDAVLAAGLPEDSVVRLCQSTRGSYQALIVDGPVTCESRT